MTWRRISTKRAIRLKLAWSESSRWSILNPARCASARRARWRTARRSRGAAGRGRCCSVNAERISARWRWRSSTRWCPESFMCSRPRATGCCRNSCRFSASRSGSFSTRSGPPPVRSRRAPTGAVSLALSSTSRRSTSSGTILTGSFNFTKAAEEGNAENLLGIQNPALAAQYTKNWRSHAEHSNPYTSKPTHR